MSTQDKEKWEKAVAEEHARMLEHRVWTAVEASKVPRGSKIIDTTWAMKKKSNGTHRARINARGFKQVDGEHYDSSSISAPVVNDTTIRNSFVLMLMMGGAGKLVDVKGAFLHGTFEDGEKIYLKVPEGFELYYPKGTLLELNKTIYGLKQSAMAFWRELLKCMNNMGYQRSSTDPCLYYRYVDGKVNLWLSWIDDCLNVGAEQHVTQAIQEMKSRFDCDELGSLSEYIGCKLDHRPEDGSIKITQPVLIQSFEDEFDLKEYGEEDCSTPAAPGQILVRGGEEGVMEPKWQRMYRKGVGKLLHLTRWSRPDIRNAVRELTKCNGVAKPAHYKAMIRVMRYCIQTKQIGWIIRPKRKWDGRKGTIKVRVSGHSDSTYASDPEDRKSISGYSVEVEETTVATKCVGQDGVALSVCEAETVAGVQCAQEMLFVKKEQIGRASCRERVSDVV
jgi:hypothetical protein